MDSFIANYLKHQRAFATLYQSGCTQRILLFKGGHGLGKTTLLKACIKQAREKKKCIITFNLDKENVSTLEIFQRSLSNFGKDKLPSLHAYIKHVYPEIYIDQPQQEGSGNIINVELQINNAHSDKLNIGTLTNAWFNDLDSFDDVVFVFFDAYEKASKEIKEWIGGLFLSRSIYCEKLRIIIAGCEVPDSNNIDWGNNCTLHYLEGVKEPKHWMELIEKQQRQLPGNNDEQLIWLSLICNAFNGQPNLIMQIVETLPECTM